jgi:type II restriction enzyme
LDSIAEQRQVFKGADHAFMWKPKPRIPDNRQNQIAFGNFLDTCLCCDAEEQVIDAIQALDRATIKGLGPAAANLLYFLHPTIAPPFNTAIVRGYNSLMGATVKLGRWDQYLAMRRGILALNLQYRSLLSNDLGAVTAFLFDVGTERYPLSEREKRTALSNAGSPTSISPRRIGSVVQGSGGSPRGGSHAYRDSRVASGFGYRPWLSGLDRRE